MTFRCDNCLIDVEDDTSCPMCAANLMPPPRPRESQQFLTDLRHSTAGERTSMQGARSSAKEAL